MKKDDLERLLDAALMDGVIEAECTICGLTIQCESDAESAWCDQCNQVVPVRNMLIESGWI